MSPRSHRCGSCQAIGDPWDRKVLTPFNFQSHREQCLLFPGESSIDQALRTFPSSAPSFDQRLVAFHPIRVDPLLPLF